MAAIGKIRKYYVVCMILIGVALLAFIVGDFGRTGKNPADVPVGTIDGEKITQRDFASEVDRITTVRSFDTDPTALAEMSYNIRQSVWNDMVKQALLNEEYDKFDIKVSVEELNDLIRGPKPHSYIVSNFKDPATGAVNYEQLNYFLENLNNPQIISSDMRQTYLYIESMIKKETAENKYNTLITKGIYVPTAFALKEHNDKLTKYDVKLVAKRYKTVQDSTVVASEADYKKYYNDNKENFKVAELADIAYVEYDIKPTQEDKDALIASINSLYEEFQTTQNIQAFVASTSETQLSNAWLSAADMTPAMSEKAFNAEPGDFIPPFEDNERLWFAKVIDAQKRPDSLNASHILIAYSGAQNASSATRTKEQAQALSDSLLKVVKKTPASFAEVAAQYSDDPSVKDEGGNLGWFTDGMMVAPFNDFAIENKVGTIGVVETVFGYHIVKVDDKTADVDKVKMAIVSRTIVPSEQTYTNAYLTMSNFAANVKTCEEMEAAAAEKGYNVKTFDAAERMTQNIVGIPNSREVIRWAFNKDTKVGQVSNIYEFEDKLVVAALKTHQQKGYKSFADAKEEMTPFVLRDKKAEVVAQQLQEAVTGAKTIDEVAVKVDEPIESSEITGNISNLGKFGSEPFVIGDIFGAPADVVGGPVKGEQAAYVFVKTLKESPAEKADFSADQRRMESQLATRVTRRAVPEIQENAKITDNRDIFY